MAFTKQRKILEKLITNEILHATHEFHWYVSKFE